MTLSRPLRFFGRFLVLLVGLLVGYMGAFNAVFPDGVTSRYGAVDAAIYVFVAYLIAAFPIGLVAPAAVWRWVWLVWLPGAAIVALYALREPAGLSWHGAVLLYAWTGAFTGAFSGVGARRAVRAIRRSRASAPSHGRRWPS